MERLDKEIIETSSNWKIYSRPMVSAGDGFQDPPVGTESPDAQIPYVK